jgi:hypothetical protein
MFLLLSQGQRLEDVRGALAEQMNMAVQHAVDGVLGRVAAVEGLQHLNSSNNSALGSEVQVTGRLAVCLEGNIVYLPCLAAVGADNQTNSNGTCGFVGKGPGRGYAWFRGCDGQARQKHLKG